MPATLDDILEIVKRIESNLTLTNSQVSTLSQRVSTLEQLSPSPPNTLHALLTRQNAILVGGFLATVLATVLAALPPRAPAASSAPPVTAPAR